MILNLDILKNSLLKIDLSKETHHMPHPGYVQYLLEKPGVEHHRLLAFLSTFFPNQNIFDIGTHYGNSSLAMSYESTANVISYDIHNVRQVINAPKNIEYCIGDFRQDNRILTSPLIMIDVDPHDGIQEKDFHEFFLKNKYKGIVLWDDIHLTDKMQYWWDSVDPKQVVKIDLTPIGHFSGTGMIIY